ncbi:hypothetical protein C2G38_2172069 [Gigaspora rosea]|uniref:Uncharacterized protein n=1 Tax=Gigaspora rosea TaxID=44941 RepID=A0A397VQ74_9GLOM|nr:hypothetical protein C2G38_2172069 [Gigaspora rosea]
MRQKNGYQYLRNHLKRSFYHSGRNNNNNINNNDNENNANNENSNNNNNDVIVISSDEEELFDLKYKEATDMEKERQAVYLKNEKDKIIRQIYYLRKHCEEMGYRLFFDE